VNFWKILSSRRFAVYTLLILFVLLILSTLVPNPAFLKQEELAALRRIPYLLEVSQYLRTDRLVTSWLFIGISIFLVVSILYCTLSRLTAEKIKQIIQPRNRLDYGPEITFKISADLDLSCQRIATYLKNNGWEIQTNSGDKRVIIQGRKGKLGFLGSILFHLSIVMLVFFGVIYSLTSFSGEMVLAEEQTLTFTEENLVGYRKATYASELPAFDLTLEKLKPQYADVKGLAPTDFEAQIRAETAIGTIRKKIWVNHPFVYKGYRFLIYRYGFAPRFVIVKNKHHQVFDSFVNLVVFTPQDSDRFQVPEENLEVRTRFFPDFYRRGKRTLATRSQVPRNPVFLVEVISDGQRIFYGLLPKGKKVKFGSYEMSFPELNYWVDFLITKNPAYWALIIASAICAAGLTLRFIYPDKKIAILLVHKRGVTEVGLAGHCRHFPFLFKEELQKIHRQIGAEIGLSV
jgi:cytochrome c biogenesis protein ResB